VKTPEQGVDEAVLALLRCPGCCGPLVPAEDPSKGLDCAGCAVRYPLRDGILILLPEEALPLA